MKNPPTVQKADLGFRRMYVQIQFGRLYFDKQSERGELAGHQILFEREQDGLLKKSVPHGTAVHDLRELSGLRAAHPLQPMRAHAESGYGRKILRR